MYLSWLKVGDTVKIKKNNWFFFFTWESLQKGLASIRMSVFVKKPFMTTKIGVFWQRNLNQLFYISLWISTVLLKSANITVNSSFMLLFILCCYEPIHYLLRCASRLNILCGEQTDSYEPYVKGQNFSQSWALYAHLTSPKSNMHSCEVCKALLENDWVVQSQPFVCNDLDAHNGVWNVVCLWNRCVNNRHCSWKSLPCNLSAEVTFYLCYRHSLLLITQEFQCSMI